ncbi:MAG: twin-arginine translocation signal domain-containing protein [Chloroflexi bacterium]|nr:MAG: twin-arginine translocation signal domain-containing protein [Chloroflexota bacterium]
MTTKIKQPDTCALSRRDFLKYSAAIGGTTAVLGSLPHVQRIMAKGEHDDVYPLSSPEHVLYSVCLNCHNACPIKAKIQDGVLVKIDGNPYSPQNMLVPLPENTPLDVSARADAPVCPKGQAGVQVLYDPYRLRRVLKRAGKRGENKWVTIDFEQAIDEIVNGGDLFGEGHVPGLKEIYKLRDPELAKELAADTDAVVNGEMTIEEFKAKHADHLDLLIDPDHPDLGPVNNQFVFLGGRMEHGRKELGKRFTYASFGSVNFYLHTTICEQSHHIAYKMMSGKTHMKPDILNSEFIIYFGTSPFEANFGPTNLVPKLTTAMVENRLKIAVVDPRLNKTATKAWKWVPIKPGMDGALALGMMRWMFENERYDATYLAAPNKDVANANNETSFTDATHLVRLDTMAFLKPEDAGLEVPVDDEGNPKSSRVVMVEGTPALSIEAGMADLFVDTTINGIPVKSALQLLKDRAFEKTLEEYAELSGVPVDDIVELAREFTSHGKKAVADFYRGPVQHTNGYYNGQAIITLNVLIGNVDWKGGLTKGGGHWHEDGSKPGAPFPKSVITSAPGGLKKFGIHVNREQATYEKSTLFEGYPAKRPWYPFTNELYQNVIPSAAAGYPYKIKAMFIQKGTPVLATPAGHAQIEMLRDPKIIPLLISCDVVVGETSMYADYIIPDLTYMERWGTPHVTPDVVTKVSKIRQPLVAPLTETVVIDGEEMPISMEAFLIAVGKKLGLPGFGKDGLGEGFDFNRPEDYYLAMAANLAFGDKEDGSEMLPPASDEEMRIFREARAHLPKSVFDEEKWKKAVPADLWPSVVTLLNRGGRFESVEKAYDGDKLHHQWKGQWNLYVEKVALGKNSMNGKNFDGLPRVEPVLDAAGNEVKDDGYDLKLITYKEVVGGQSRTHGAYWLDAVLPENTVWVNSRDAQRLGLRTGDRVRVVGPTLTGGFDLGDGRSYEVIGTVKVVEGILPGTVAASWSYGHWAYGSNDIVIDGETIKGDRRRSTGIVPNPAMRLDPVVGDVCLTDPIGGSASFYDSWVKLEKI